MLSAIMPSVENKPFKLIVVMLSVAMLSVIMTNVVALLDIVNATSRVISCAPKGTPQFGLKNTIYDFRDIIYNYNHNVIKCLWYRPL